MAASGTGSFVFIDDVSADGSSRMNSSIYKCILTAQPSALKLLGNLPGLNQSNDPKHL